MLKNKYSILCAYPICYQCSDKTLGELKKYMTCTKYANTDMFMWSVVKLGFKIQVIDQLHWQWQVDQLISSKILPDDDSAEAL